MNETAFSQGLALLKELREGFAVGVAVADKFSRVAGMLVEGWAEVATAAPIVTGIAVELDAEEMRHHLEERAAYHAEKVKHYERQVVANEKAQRKGAYLSAGPMQSNDPIAALKQSAQHHRQRYGFFAVLAANVIDGARYRLSEQDFARLELLDRYL